MSYIMLYLSRDRKPVPDQVVPLGKAPQGTVMDTLLQKLY